MSAGEILKSNVQLLGNEGRQEYFSHDSQCDLFIDPDIGIENTRPRKKEKEQREKYILLSETASLIPQDSSRLLLVFQYSSNGKDWLQKKSNDIKNYLSNNAGTGGVFAYFAGQTSMVFVSRDTQRLMRICDHIGEFLGPISTCRLIRVETI